MIIRDPRVKCARCGKPRGQHKAITLHCPWGMKTRIGYTSYEKDQVFEMRDNHVPGLTDRQKKLEASRVRGERGARRAALATARAALDAQGKKVMGVNASLKQMRDATLKEMADELLKAEGWRFKISSVRAWSHDKREATQRWLKLSPQERDAERDAGKLPWLPALVKVGSRWVEDYAWETPRVVRVLAVEPERAQIQTVDQDHVPGTYPRKPTWAKLSRFGKAGGYKRYRGEGANG